MILNKSLKLLGKILIDSNQTKFHNQSRPQYKTFLKKDSIKMRALICLSLNRASDRKFVQIQKLISKITL